MAPINDSPVLASIGSKSVKTNVILAFTATATDPDKGQTKTFSLLLPPTGATINATTGLFNWKPVTTGVFTFKVRVTDNGVPVLYDEEQIKVTVTAAALLIESNSEVSEPEEQNFSKPPVAFPNPVKDKCLIVLNPSFTNISASMMDMKGSLITNWSVTNNNAGKFEFDMGRLKTGTYIMRLNSANRSWVIKLIKL
jgi:hypothetical protein